MGDGGWRPGFNVQFGTDCASQVIVAMEVVTAGSDTAQLAPMIEPVERRLGKAPGQWLVDGGCPAHAQLDAGAGKTELDAPVPKPPKAEAKPHDESGGHAARAKPAEPSARPLSEFDPKPGDSEAVAQWRTPMNSTAARAICKLRAATAECVNALARNRGLQRLPVRGLAKVKCVVRLFVPAHKLMRMAALAPQSIGWGMGAKSMSPQSL